jgi:NadR type nicotinamide-nucleotide adenylyltransferase
MPTAKKIVVIGPESTGKSSLCKFLAQHYNTTWVAESARTYLEMHGINYNIADVAQMAKMQIAANDAEAYNTTHSFIFCDTDMLVMQVWCEFVFNSCPPFILENLANSDTTFYLLAAPTIPWVRDNLREYPDEKTRQYLYQCYLHLVQETTKPFAVINATTFTEREAQAIAAIDNFFK